MPSRKGGHIQNSNKKKIGKKLYSQPFMQIKPVSAEV